MEIVENPLEGCFLLRNSVYKDERGYFFESFNQRRFRELTNLDVNFVQDNQSQSSFGVVRGLHFQRGEFSQAKLVRVLNGRVIDVAVDIRPYSPTFGKSFSVELTPENGLQLFMSRGFAHGFSVLSQTAIFFYKCDSYYHKASEGIINPLDIDLNIDWGLSLGSIILSDKDKYAQSWESFCQKSNPGNEAKGGENY